MTGDDGRPGRGGVPASREEALLRACFVPLLDPAGTGNGVHIHLSFSDAERCRRIADVH